MRVTTNAFIVASLISAGFAKPITLGSRTTAPTLKVLPLGDSITYGFKSTDGNGYRADLQKDFTSYAIDLVGTQTSGTMADNHHEGHCGATITEINGYVDSDFTLKPDVVLVLAGTNDMVQKDSDGAASRLSALIGNVLKGIPGATVLVGTIPPIWYALPQRNAYNAALPGVVASFVNAGDHVMLVNMESNVTQAVLSDDLHPNDYGYKLMASCWSSGLTEAAAKGWLPGSTATPYQAKTTATSDGVLTISASASPYKAKSSATSAAVLTTLTVVPTPILSYGTASKSTVTIPTAPGLPKYGHHNHTITSEAVSSATSAGYSTVDAGTVTVPDCGSEPTSADPLPSYANPSPYSSMHQSSPAYTTPIVPVPYSASTPATILTLSLPHTSLPQGSATFTKTSTSSSTTAAASSAAPVVPVAPGGGNVNPQYEAVAKSALAALTQTFTLSQHGWNHIGGWIGAVVYQDMMDYDYWTKGTTNSVYAESLLAIVSSQNLLNGAGAIDSFNDDQGWWILAFIRAYEVYGHVELLNQAEKQWKQIQATSQLASNNAGSTPNLGGLARNVAIPATCDVGGAVYWEQTAGSPITAISTGLFAQIGAWLYAITKDEQYRKGADLAINFERRKFLNVNSGIMDIDNLNPQNCQNGLGSLTYNTGVYLSALTSLYTSTGEAQYLEWATTTATSSVTGSFGNENGAPLVVDQEEKIGNNDQGYIWPDVLFRSITEFHAVLVSKNLNPTLQGQIKTFFKANYDYIQAHGKYGDNYSVNWWGNLKEGSAQGTASVMSVLTGCMVML